MNSITEIKDILIAEEIHRIQAIPSKKLRGEFIETQTRKIEEMSESEVLKMCHGNKNGN